MPDMTQPAMPAGLAAQIPVAMPYGDDDVALGCECADPSLQIERWGEPATVGARNESH